MPMLYIYKKGDECLEKRCKVTRFDKRLKLLVRDMKETLESANGVETAPQVGIIRRVFVVNMDGR